MLKTWVWIAGEHAALLRAKTYDEAYGMVLSEIIYGGCFIARNQAVRSDSSPSNALVKEAVEIFDNNAHNIQEITESDVSRRPLDTSKYAETL